MWALIYPSAQIQTLVSVAGIQITNDIRWVQIQVI
jgi:hypothetical protein